MKLIKNINNNFALAQDDAGNRLIVSGRGIGFGEVPRILKDLSMINRSYYDVDESYVSMINDIPEEIIEISTLIVDKARLLIDNPISSNIVFTLADHINFCIERYKKNMDIKLPIVYDVQHFFEKEYSLGLFALEKIEKIYQLKLPKEEASYIALHIINAEEREKNSKTEYNDEKIIYDIADIIEKDYGITIDKSDFNYSRFVTHMHYLLKRGKTKHLMKTDNDRIYQTMKTDYPKTYETAEHVSNYLNQESKLNLTDEEKLYIMLHINRLCTREDCNQ